jgi:hypothetical protein
MINRWLYDEGGRSCASAERKFVAPHPAVAFDSYASLARPRNTRLRSESFSFDAEIRGQTHAQITNVNSSPSAPLLHPPLAHC